MSDQPRPTGPELDNVRWLRGLRDLTQNWLKETGGLIGRRQEGTTRRGVPIYVPTPIPMDAYADLIFAFGLARVGGRSESRELLDCAQAALTALNDRAHAALLKGYEYQITQVWEGKPHAGPAPAQWVQWVEGGGRLDRYRVDRLRRHSRILEPAFHVNPYREWGARIDDFCRALADLEDVTDSEEIIRRVERLFEGLPAGEKGKEQQARIVDAALNVAARTNVNFGRRLLGQALALQETLPEAKALGEFSARAQLLGRAVSVAAWFNLRECGALLASHFRKLLSVVGPRTFQLDNGSVLGAVALAPNLAQCIQALQKLGEREELTRLLGQANRFILEERGRLGSGPEQPASDPETLRPLLHVAAGMLSQGQQQEAEGVLAETRSILLRPDEGSNAARWSSTPRLQAALAVGYAAALAEAPSSEAKERLEELFRCLPDVRDGYTTMSHFSVACLEVIEAAVLPAVEVLTRSDEPLTVTT
jgi:hypothetical protein